ncbi:MAG TPA: DUF2325 domain-containing protein [Kofleriaceae bacterium]|jgi:hypothetical protein|nr:DUF2325 domain-containing protein [Kofleriaceae bacterium]
MANTHRMRVAIVGGLSRAHGQWERAGDALGVELEHHAGQTQGRHSDELAAVVRRADVVVIITNPNSHNGVAVARRTAQRWSRPHLLIKHLRPDGLGPVLADALAMGRTRAAVS